MTLRDFGGVLRSAWILLAATTIVGALAGLGISRLITPVYQGQAQLFVSVQSADDASGSYAGDLYVQARMTSYVSLVDTPRVLEPVIEDLELDMTPAQLAEQVTAENPPDTVLITVLADAGDAKQAADIADVTAEALADEIMRLETTESGAKPVKAEGILFADGSAAPVKPRTTFNILMGALLGLLAGLAVAILRANRDTSITSTAELQLASNSTLLGAIENDPDADSEPLAMVKDTARAEAYRTLRTNLKFVHAQDAQHCIVVTSPSAQEGKSVTAANLAVALAQSGSRVVLVDADLRNPILSGVFGVEPSPGLTDLLTQRKDLHKDAASVIVAPQGGLVDFLPPGQIPPNPTELLSSQRFAELLGYLMTEYDVVIVDAPPLQPVSDAAILGAMADGVLLVARHGSTRREQVEESTATLARVNGRLLGVVLNCVPRTRTRSGKRSLGRRGRGHQADDQTGAPGSGRSEEQPGAGATFTGTSPTLAHSANDVARPPS